MALIAPAPTWIMTIVSLAALLLVLGPLIAAVVLAVRRRWIPATVCGTLGLFLLMTGLTGAFVVTSSVSKRPVPAVAYSETEVHDPDAGRRGVGGTHTVHGPNGPIVMSSPGSFTPHPDDDPWHDAARRHGERLRERDGERRFHEGPRGRHEWRGEGPTAPTAEVLDASELPDWVTNPDENRLVVSGPRLTDEDGGPPAARRAAEEAVADRLAQVAGLPAGAAINPDDVTRPGTVRRAVIETRTLTTGENTFTVYRGHLLVDASPETLDHLRRGYRDRLGRDRALWIAGGAGLCVAFFAGLWGVGRRKLRQA